MNTNSMMNSIAEAIENTDTKNDSDYIWHDGLLYCGKCHTPKQKRISWFDGTEKVVGIRCACELEKQKQEEEQSAKREREARIAENRSVGIPDAMMREYTFQNDDKANPKVTKIAKNFVDNFETFKANGKGIVFCGGVGTGKTYMAICIANAVIDQGYTALVTNFAKIVNTLSGMYQGKQDYIDSLCKYDLLVIDDLATERNTEYMNEIVYTIIDSRYRSHKPLIVTTNLSYGAIRNPNDVNKQRIYSRITEMCYPVAVEGKDRRSENINLDLYNLLNK